MLLEGIQLVRCTKWSNSTNKLCSCLVAVTLTLTPVLTDAAPELSVGDILVCEFDGRVLRIDPATGDRCLITDSQTGSGGPLFGLTGIAVDSRGDIFVSTAAPLRILRIDPATGDKTLVTSDLSGNPGKLEITADGSILQHDSGSVALVKIDPDSGDTSILSSFTLEIGTGEELGGDTFVVSADGNVFVTRQPTSTYDVAIMEVDSCGNRSIAFDETTTGTILNSPDGIDINAQGNLIVGQALIPSILRVNTTSGGFATIASNTVGDPDFTPGGFDLAIGPDDTIFVLNSRNNAGTVPAAVFRIDPNSGERIVLSGRGFGAGPELDNPRAIQIVKSLNTDPVAAAGPDRVVECQGALTLVQLDGTGSFDPDGDSLAFEWSLAEGTGAMLDDLTVPAPLGMFPLGPTMVTLTVKDGLGGLATADVLVTVEDTTPPVAVCTTDRVALWPPNHESVAVSIDVLVSDLCADPENLIVLCSALSNELDDELGDGSFTGDVNGQDGFSSPVPVALTYDATERSFKGAVALRAERSGLGSGRSYSVICDVADLNGNLTTASCVVLVPHSRK